MVLLNLLWVLAGLVSAALFYASVPHQQLLSSWPQRGALRAAGCVLFAISLLMAVYVLGFSSGVFAALTALMLGCVALPYLSAWRVQKDSAHVE